MKAIDNGCFFSVQISRQEVSDFADKWPCAHFPDRGLWAQFDKRNGDLIDVKPDFEELGADGSAVMALIQDGQNYAAKELSLDEVCFRR